MKFPFRPTEGAFYELFTRAAQNLVRGTELLNELALPGVDVQSVSDRLTDVEHDSDEITHTLYKKINSTFITPFDREDIYQLATVVDDVVDYLEEASDLLGLYGVDAVVIDMTRLDFIDSSGISRLVELRQMAIAAGADFRLVSLAPNVRRVLEITGLLQTFGVDE